MGSSVLFGDHAPTGRLPIMLPATSADTIEPVAQENATIRYLEQMATSYRNKDFNAAFPFGHGLTYTTFEYKDFAVHRCGHARRGHDVCITGRIANTGKRAGGALPQLYLEFPQEAGHPAPVLKGFQKTNMIRPGGEERVTFRLGDSELSYYSEGSWTRVHDGVVHIGSSSRDISFSSPFSSLSMDADVVV